MERERGDARESFPCTAAASAGSGGAEQEQRDGAEPGERDPGTARMEKIPGVSSTYTVLSTGIYKPIDPLFSGR